MEKVQEAAIEFYTKLVDTIADVEIKGASMPYTSLNGHMFSQLGKSGEVGLRLPKDVRTEFIEKYNTGLFESYGAVMKEYVSIPLDLLKDTKQLKDYFQASFDYVGSLKPKAIKKRK